VRVVAEVTSGETAVVGETLPPSPAAVLDRRIRLALTGAGEGGADADPEALAKELRRALAVEGVLLGQLTKARDGLALGVALVMAEGATRRSGARCTGGREEGLRALADRLADALRGVRSSLEPPADVGLDFSTALLGRPAVKSPAPGIEVPPPQVGGGDAVPPDGGESAPVQPPVWKRWWFWTAIGGGAALVLVTTLALSLGPETSIVQDPDTVRIQVLTDP